MITYDKKPVRIIAILNRPTKYSPAMEPPDEVEVAFIDDKNQLIPHTRHCLVLVTQLEETEPGEIQMGCDLAPLVQD